MTAEFGLALENFTPEHRRPSIEALLEYSTTAERLGFSSLWAWDHLFLGTRKAFPFFESLTTLSLLALRTERITLGTGVLVLPIREPAVLAKATATLQIASGGRLALGVAAGWYEREFQATGVSFSGRGRVFERNLEILYRLWQEDDVTGSYDGRVFNHVRAIPKPEPRPRVLVGGYVDRVLERAATKSDGWLTYFYTAESFRRSWAKVAAFAEKAGRDPSELHNVAQVPLCVGRSYEEATSRVLSYLGDYFDMPAWSESSAESSVRGTPGQCAEQIDAYLSAGVQHLVFCPCDYELEQIQRLAAEVLPLLGHDGATAPR
jgi:probable F420-dependent oxidoreductase